MKLLMCISCKHIFNLSMGKKRVCDCGQTSGQYLDELNAEYSGPGLTIGFANSSFVKAYKNQPQSGLGSRFEAFIIEKDCPTFKRCK